MPSDDGQILRNLRESPDDRSRLSQDCTEPRGGGRVLPRRIAGFSCRRQKICFAGLASRGYGNLMLTLEQQAAFVEEAPEIFLPFPGGWGKMGYTDIRLAAASEDALTGALRTAWKLRIDRNAKTSRNNPHVAERGGVTGKKCGKGRL
jgi:hypothetical protein